MPKYYITESDEGEVFAGWFDTETAQACYEPSAGSPAFHETLWESAGGRWVIQTIPRRIEGRDGWRFVTEEDARRWRTANIRPEGH